MIELHTPNGLKSMVPENEAEDTTPRFNVENNLEDGVRYYKDKGYVIFTGCVSKENCSRLKDLWEEIIKPYKGTIYRQTTAKAEKNILNENGWIMNPILNLQSLNPKHFGILRHSTEDSVFSNNAICKVLKSILGEKPKIVQSMYFEGNSATWEHQDSYYLDSEKIGLMTAGWLALEEIKADAGRFFICPESHKIDLGRQNIENNIADNHDKYIAKVVSIIKSKNMPIKAPYMTTGDVLFWNSWTIHGSLDSQSKTHSRSSITMHAIPESHKFLQLHSRLINVPTDDLGSSLVYRPKDQKKFKNRLILATESYFPNIFYWMKKKAIKSLVNRKTT